jgi:hypothetical protein
MTTRTAYDHERAKLGKGDIVGLAVIVGAIAVGILWFA